MNAVAAAMDENKPKLVESGVVAHYVKLLSTDREQTLQAQAASGIWTLAFNCADTVVKQPGCVDGLYFTVGYLVRSSRRRWTNVLPLFLL